MTLSLVTERLKDLKVYLLWLLNVDDREIKLVTCWDGFPLDMGEFFLVKCNLVSLKNVPAKVKIVSP
jgi:hypothetical protein